MSKILYYIFIGLITILCIYINYELFTKASKWANNSDIEKVQNQINILDTDMDMLYQQILELEKRVKKLEEKNIGRIGSVIEN